MKARFAVIFLLTLLLSLPSWGEEGKVGNGGDVVVCFNIPLKEAVDKKGMVTEKGWQNIKGPIVTLDYYEAAFLVGLDNPAKPKLINLEKYSFAEILQLLRDKTRDIPQFYQSWLAVAENFSEQHWKGAKTKLVDINDSAPSYLEPLNGIFYQAAVRQDDVIYYDHRVLEHLSASQRALLRIHEELYRIALGCGQKDSGNVRKMIYCLLLENNSTAEIREALNKYGLGRYPLLIEINKEIDALEKKIGPIETDFFNQDLVKLFELKLERGDSLEKLEPEVEKMYTLRWNYIYQKDKSKNTRWHLQEMEKDRLRLLKKLNNNKFDYEYLYFFICNAEVLEIYN